MEFPFELLINAIIAGLLLGGFYAAVTVGISISFGILDIVNIAHPAFIIVGAYIAYIVNQTFGFDPILTAIVVLPAFFAVGAAVYHTLQTEVMRSTDYWRLILGAMIILLVVTFPQGIAGFAQRFVRREA